ncbi:Similar to Plectasin; acc. no. Q53I06 [Pyronema omphalodes CBS 100304]|uniref:Similar to Plectasin acc. no. Q53I06 n=1 Tax=Pyronema omphalodes (strain CBS 100304) TaxID=1076935 RepID=U4LNY7_PYROM|nr:Similar to Plectasin; acc. no. Q53I06 [Pyronema omphalodes CBS 100304]
MQFTTAFTVVLTVFGLLNGVLAAPQPLPEGHAVSDPDANPDHYAGVDNALIKKRGFGCGGPWNEDDMQCHNHCKSIKGYKGGYCASAGFVCKCY